MAHAASTALAAPFPDSAVLVALNCVANSRILREGPFEEVWVQPAAGTRAPRSAARCMSRTRSATGAPMDTAALGRSWTDEDIAAGLARA